MCRRKEDRNTITGFPTVHNSLTLSATVKIFQLCAKLKLKNCVKLHCFSNNIGLYAISIASPINNAMKTSKIYHEKR